MKNILLCLLLGLGAWSCSEDQLTTYEGELNSMYFAKEYPNTWRDTNEFSFALYLINDTVISFEVQALGDLTDYDRAFRVVVDESSTATAGKHFDALLPEYILPANSRYAKVPMKIHRTDDLYDTIVSLTLCLVPNENFKQSVTEKEYEGKQVNIVRKTLMFSSVTTQPKYWMPYYLGYFSVTKFNLTNKILGINPADWYTGKISMGQMIGAGTFMTNYLNERLGTKNPADAIKDPDPKSTRGYMTFNNVNIPDTYPDAWPK